GYHVAPNGGPARSGTLRIAGQGFTISQSGNAVTGSCTFAISPTNRTHGYAGASASVTVTTQIGCAWSVVNTNPWVVITHGTNGSGSGTVSYLISSNSTPDMRRGIIN